MASVKYRSCLAKFLSGSINLLTADVKAVLLDLSEYTSPNFLPAGDSTLADIPTAARVATSANFTGKTVTDGIFDADDIVFEAVSGPVCGGIAIYAGPSTDLICYIDMLPITPNGSNIEMTWHNGSNKIFAL